MGYEDLKSEEISRTIALLYRRINDRFPDSDLKDVCRRLHGLAEKATLTGSWAARPIYWIRGLCVLFVMLVGWALAGTLLNLKPVSGHLTFFDFIQLFEAGTNDVVLIGAGLYFLFTLETRIKRRRILRELQELRIVAHIVDMHQLTKDPEIELLRARATTHSPQRRLTSFLMGRYLDYSSEMLSLSGKLAALYIQKFEDPVTIGAVNEFESLTTGLSRKIWQKIMILNARRGLAAGRPDQA